MTEKFYKKDAKERKFSKQMELKQEVYLQLMEIIHAFAPRQPRTAPLGLSKA